MHVLSDPDRGAPAACRSTRPTRLLTALLVAGTLLLVAPPPARSAACGDSLAGLGQMVPAIGYPQYYVDHSGLALQLCLNDPLLCLAPKPNLNAPASVPANFPEETFYWGADASIPLPGGNDALLVLATEAAFANGPVVQGDQVTFSRIRVRARGVTPGGVYTFTHPYGVVVAQADDRGRLTDTQDSLFFAGQGSPINFQGPLASPIGPWLVWDATAPAPPAGFIGDPNVLHTVTGSPCGQNFFRIEGPGLPAGGLETNLFAVQGQKINICGNGFLDVTEDCDRVDVAGDCCGADCKFVAAGTTCNNTCQIDPTCDGAGVCGGGTPTLIQAACEDGNACSFRDTCSAGQCIAGGTPPCAVGTVEADAVVAQASPKSKFGTAKTLEIDGSPVREGLFRVRVLGLGGQPVQHALLRLVVGSAKGSDADSGGQIRVASCDWTESAVTWNLRPTVTPTVIASQGPVSLKGTVDFDVASAITGDGVYCFALDTTSADNVIYNSREASAALRPQLLINTGCASCTAPVCGDNLINRTAEQCDGADDATCPGRCRADCTCGPPPVCGDNVVNQPTEDCDGTDAASCPGVCKADCTCPVCGDNLVNQASEQCDGTADAVCPGGCQVDCTCAPGTLIPTASVIADTYVAQATPTRNFGTATAIGADNSPVEQMLLKISVGGVGARTVTSAKLRMQVSNASNLRGRIHTMTDCSWGETTVTWNTKPAFNAAVLNAPAGTAAVGNIVEFDLTGAITADGTTCFAIDNTSSDGVQYKSREGAALRPEVVLTVAP